MRREGVDPDTITYNSLLKAAAAAGLLREARQVYAELLASGLRPSTFTYAALFNAAARARAGDAEWLLQVGLREGRVGACGQACTRGCSPQRHGAHRAPAFRDSLDQCKLSPSLLSPTVDRPLRAALPAAC